MFAQLVTSVRVALPVLFEHSFEKLSIENFVQELGQLEPRIFDHVSARPAITAKKLRELKLSECGLQERADRIACITRVEEHYGISLPLLKRREIIVFDRPLKDLRRAVHNAMLQARPDVYHAAP